MIMLTHGIYTTLAAGYADPSVLLVSPFSFASLPLINGSGAYSARILPDTRPDATHSLQVGLGVQLFFAWRIQVLNRSLLTKFAAGTVALVRRIHNA